MVFFPAIFLLFFHNNIHGTSIPVANPFVLQIAGFIAKPAEKLRGFPNPDIRLFEKSLGRKLKLKEKIVLKILQLKMNRRLAPVGKEVITDYGKTAFILGLIGALVLLIPVLNLASIPLAILAIVFGNKAKKTDPHNRKARTAITIGIVTLAFLVTIGLVVALVLTIGSFPR
jgi:hypothetical protein